MILFPHIPKTAGTSVKYILRKNFGIRHVDAVKTKKYPFTRKDLEFAKKIFPGPEAITGHNLVDPVTNLAGPDDKLITILRDPVIRCASHFQDDVTRRGYQADFDQWINDPGHQDLSVRIISGNGDLERAKEILKEQFHFVGITEQFNQSLKLFTLFVNESLDMNYRRLITATDNRIKKELLNDDYSLKLLKKHNAKDAELYDFALNELFHPMLNKHSDALDNLRDPVQLDGPGREAPVRNSILFNKYIYRQLIKIA